MNFSVPLLIAAKGYQLHYEIKKVDMLPRADQTAPYPEKYKWRKSKKNTAAKIFELSLPKSMQRSLFQIYPEKLFKSYQHILISEDHSHALRETHSKPKYAQTAQTYRWFLYIQRTSRIITTPPVERRSITIHAPNDRQRDHMTLWEPTNSCRGNAGFRRNHHSKSIFFIQNAWLSTISYENQTNNYIGKTYEPLSVPYTQPQTNWSTQPAVGQIFFFT